MATKIQMMKLAEVQPYWRNPRNNEAAVEAVMQSISDYGFRNPILVDSEHVIIAGHTRYKAAMRLELDKVPVIVVDDLPQDKVSAFRIADNKTSELAEWDMNKLVPELRSLIDLPSMQVYFPDEDLERLVQEQAGVNLQGPDADAIARVNGELNDQFKDRSQANQGAYVEITCPHCGEPCYVDREEVSRRPGVDKPGE